MGAMRRENMQDAVAFCIALLLLVIPGHAAPAQTASANQTALVLPSVADGPGAGSSPSPAPAASPSPSPAVVAAAATQAQPVALPTGPSGNSPVPSTPNAANVVSSPSPVNAQASPKPANSVNTSPAPAPASSPAPKNAASPAPNASPAPKNAASPAPNASPVPKNAASPAPNASAKPSPAPASPPAKVVSSPSPAANKPSPSPAAVNTSPAAAPNSGPLYNTVAPSVYTQVETWLDSGNITIPKSFMGISHEWPYVQELNNIPEYPNIIQMLNSFGGGPMIVRVGGGSTDLQTTVPGNDVWGPLAALYKSTGTKYILGLNFYSANVTLARLQMQAAQKGLPADAIVGFEIGNEPNFYINKSGASDVAYVRCCLTDEWKDFAYQLSCPRGNNSCINGQFIGPVWGHINVRPSTIDWFLVNTARFVKLTTVHWYKATAEAYNTAATLLEEDPIRREADNLAQLVRVSNGFGKPLRVAEMNSISNSGRWNVSNVFASALWTLDVSFEVAQAGGVGVNFHQGAGQNIYAAIVRWYVNGKLAPPQLRPAFYGMLMFNMAVRGSSKLLNKKVTPYNSTSADAAKMVKIWPLQDNETGELRWVIINKHDLKGSRVRVRINRQKGYNTKATVMRLVARGSYPLKATTGITLGGQVYGNGAAITGSQVLETVDVTLQQGMLQFNVNMPPGSAALVRLFRV